MVLHEAALFLNDFSLKRHSKTLRLRLAESLDFLIQTQLIDNIIYHAVQLIHLDIPFVLV